MNSKPWRQPYSIIIVATAINAALYAVLSFATAYVPSPWGMGQFRPAVVVPTFFAAIFGPWAGGVGAALGTLIADSIKHGELYFGSLIAAVPGNFIGFFLFGYVLRKKFSWARFVTMTNVALIVANVIVAFLYVFAYKLMYVQASAFTQLTPSSLVVLPVGLTIFWFVTMLPFVLLLVPPMIKAVASAFPHVVSEDIKENCSKHFSGRLLGTSMLIPGIILIVIGLAVTFASFGNYLSTNFAGYFPDASLMLLQIMLYAGGLVLSSLGLIFVVKRDSNSKNQTK